VPFKCFFSAFQPTSPLSFVWRWSVEPWSAQSESTPITAESCEFPSFPMYTPYLLTFGSSMDSAPPEYIMYHEIIGFTPPEIVVKWAVVRSTNVCSQNLACTT